MRKAIELYNIGSWRVPEALCQFEMQFKKKIKKKKRSNPINFNERFDLSSLKGRGNISSIW